MRVIPKSGQEVIFHIISSFGYRGHRLSNVQPLWSECWAGGVEQG